MDHFLQNRDKKTSIFESISQMLAPFQKQVEKWIYEFIPHLGEKTQLRDACEYALLNGGKRFRPIFVLMIAKALGNGIDISRAALAIELFHTASLVADDLPCMDDEDERRQKPSVHKMFGETVALLVSYGLIAEGYGCLAKNGEIIRHSQTPFAHLSDRICVLALENATFNTGIFGATGGQYLDIYPPNFSLETLKEIIQKKTISLFEISFVFGWLFGGGKLEQLDIVKKAAYHFGMAFQIADDIDDLATDIQNKKAINVALALGEDVALKMLCKEVEEFLKTLKILQLESPELKMITSFLRSKFS